MKYVISFWVFPTIIFILTPYAWEPSFEQKLILVITCLIMILAASVGSLVPVKMKQHRVSSSRFYHATLSSSLILCLIINGYIYENISFNFVLFDISLRSQVYDSAGVFWSLLVTLMTVAALVYGLMPKERISWSVRALFFFNIFLFVGYGMKASLLQVLLCFYVGRICNRGENSNEPSISGYSGFWKILKFAVILLFGFWAINSLRGGATYGLFEFGEMLYLYIAPNYTNFLNVVGSNFEYNLPLGGVFGGIYKLFGYSETPLDQLDESYIENLTWNVWTYLSTLYVSGGLFEVYFGSLIVGMYAAFSSKIFNKGRCSLTGAMNYCQMILLMVFLHNHYYYSSFAPLLSIFICFMIELFSKTFRDPRRDSLVLKSMRNEALKQHEAIQTEKVS